MTEKILEEKIKKIFSQTLGLEKVELELTHPAEQKFGDYATNFAIRVSKSVGQSPIEIAKSLSDNLYKSDLNLLIDKIEVVEPGFINIFLKDSFLLQETTKILKESDSYGRSDLLSHRKVVIEFAHPNTHKEFHVGHLRNISLGESMVRSQQFLGAKVWRVNYQGDVGLHVAKALWGIKHLGLMSEGRSLLERVNFLAKAYVEGNQAYEGAHKDEVEAINQRVYQKDPEVLELWRKTRAWSLEYFDWVYRRLGTQFDRLFFESEVSQPGLEVARKALKLNILKESEGAIIFDGAPYGLDKRVFINRQGLPTYEAKELGLAALEFSEFGQIDQLIHLVGPEQQSFFKVTFKVEALLDAKKYKGKQFHLVYGYVQLKEGKMSSRRGNVVTAVSVIEAAKAEIKKMIKLTDLSKEEVEEIAEKVAIGAVKYALLKTAAKNDIAFDLKESVSLEGNSAPYLQYTYARARSVLRKAEANFQFSISNLNSNFKFQISNFGPEETALLRTFYKFPEVVEAAGLNYSPHLICNFLFDLAQKFNLFYNNVKILNGNEESGIRNHGQNEDLKTPNSSFIIPNSHFRLIITAATAQILKNGLYLLGIEVPERM